MQRREFLSLACGLATILSPVGARAQQSERVRRIGVLLNMSESDPTATVFVSAFRQGLTEAGWTEGRNVRIDMRWAAGDRDRYRAHAEDLARFDADAYLAATTAAVASLQRASPNVPIVFVGMIDPVGAGVITSMARPGGNATGFTVFEYTIASKWMELLREIAPAIRRVAVLRDANVASGIGQFAAAQVVAPASIELSVIDMSSAGQVESAIATFAREPNGGLIVTAGAFGANNPQVVTSLAARYNLPAIYPFRYFIDVGGLICYGPNYPDQYRRAGAYVARLLQGQKPADLPVQAPVKYDLVINLKSAKALGLTVAPTLLARADELIE